MNGAHHSDYILLPKEEECKACLLLPEVNRA